VDRGYFSFSLKFFLVLPIRLSEAKKKRSERRGAKERKRSFQRLKELEAAGETGDTPFGKDCQNE
jgi:hypothetical protein